MKTRSIYFLATLFAALALFASPDSKAQQANISATLILASNQGDSFDPALKAFESNLKRLFKYTSYKLQGRSNARLSLPGDSTINIGSGHKLTLNAQAGDKGKVRLSVRWSDGRRNLISTTINMAKGSPAILGGPSAPAQNGNLILVLIAR